MQDKYDEETAKKVNAIEEIIRRRQEFYIKTGTAENTDVTKLLKSYVPEGAMNVNLDGVQIIGQAEKKLNEVIPDEIKNPTPFILTEADLQPAKTPSPLQELFIKARTNIITVIRKAMEDDMSYFLNYTIWEGSYVDNKNNEWTWHPTIKKIITRIHNPETPGQLNPQQCPVCEINRFSIPRFVVFDKTHEFADSIQKRHYECFCDNGYCDDCMAVVESIMETPLIEEQPLEYIVNKIYINRKEMDKIQNWERYQKYGY